MKLVLKSKETILDDRFIMHVINLFPSIVFSKENQRKLKAIDKYLQENVFTGRRKFTTKQIINIVLKNMVYHTDGRNATIEISNTAVFPFYIIKVKDVAKLINDGNLEIKGTHIFSDLFNTVKENIINIRNNYEMGLI